MNSLQRDVIKALIHTRKFDVINDAINVTNPSAKKIIFYEYSGDGLRVFKNANKDVCVMCPENIDAVMENALTNAIELGTIYDRADEVDSYADYICKSTLPVNALRNKSFGEPKQLHVAIGSVLGKMDENFDSINGRTMSANVDDETCIDKCCVSDTSITNGNNFVHDITHMDDERTELRDVVNNYLCNKDDALPAVFRPNISELMNEIESINSISPEDSITDDDYEFVEADDNWSDPDTGIPASYNDNTGIGEESFKNEGFLTKKPKKLKPFSRDLVPWITVEINNIQDSNDQSMIVSYICAKLELVDFYINVIDTKDARYIVPHTRDYLITLQKELNNLLTKALNIRPINKNDRAWRVNVDYPDGWRG